MGKRQVQNYQTYVIGGVMLKSEDFPCPKCPVLAICVAKKIIDCPIITRFLTKYQRTAKYPMWPNMLAIVRETLRGNWCVIGYNDRIVFLEKDRTLKSANYRIKEDGYEVLI